jgi:hypothetical protein
MPAASAATASSATGLCPVRGSVARFCSGLCAPHRQHRRPVDRARRPRRLA